MDFLKKFWPVSFKLKEKEVKPFVITLIVYVVIGAIAGVASLLSGIVFEALGLAFLGVLVGVVTSVIDLYCTAGIVFAILKFVNVFKD